MEFCVIIHKGSIPPKPLMLLYYYVFRWYNNCCTEQNFITHEQNKIHDTEDTY